MTKMMTKAKKVFVSLSGGVDSSVAAALLQKDFDCSAVFIVTSDESVDSHPDAEKVANKLGIKLYILDLRKDFEQILEYFCKEYENGRTPNPCVVCNRVIKFGKLWKFAKENGADMLATGHYARILRDQTGTGLYETVNLAKDQSYALAMIDKNMLKHVILPIGEYSKEQIREMAKKLDLGVEKKQESQEICFAPNDDYAVLLEKRCPHLIQKGNIIDISGNILGEHNGIFRFTIGQRRGLKVAMGEPYYVTKLDAKTNTVTLGPKKEVMHKKLMATNLNWLIEEVPSSFRAKVKIRYNNAGFQGCVTIRNDKAIVDFDEDISAITAGQLAVFYIQQKQGYKVAGSGWIDKAYE